MRRVERQARVVEKPFVPLMPHKQYNSNRATRYAHAQAKQGMQTVVPPQRWLELIIRAFAGPSSQAACPSGRTSPAVSLTDRGSAVGSDSRTRHGAAPTLHRSRQ